MKRDKMISALEETELWDILIIGGGATGTGTAVEAASRGYRTLLVEQSDFGKGTSSRSTKLVHGGVRYLQQGNISLVLEALKERGNLLRNAPHLVRNLPFVVPSYDWWEGPFYGIGLKIYDMMAGDHGFGKSHLLTREETVNHIPTIETGGLRGGVIYYDGQFDDARLVINLAETAAELNSTCLNYFRADSLIHINNFVRGITATDLVSGKKYNIESKVVINATGVFTDTIRKLDDKNATPVIKPSRGTHIVLDKSFLPNDNAIMVPKTDDGRILFAIPWYNRVIIGTTDIPVENPDIDPVPDRSEIEFLLTHAARYLKKDPGEKDILSIFSGLRPLVGNSEDSSTSQISRDHTIIVSPTGLVTIAGGKWTTYRKMAEDTIDQASIIGGLNQVKSVTENLKIHGYRKSDSQNSPFSFYGSDSLNLEKLIKSKKEYSQKIHPGLNRLTGEVIWAVRNEMVQTVEDFLSRRTRSLLLDAKASIDAAPKVAEIIASESGYDNLWIENQVNSFINLAKNYYVK